ncbi:MAG: GGDEF domain-containing protein [Neptuniibacter sp.]
MVLDTLLDVVSARRHSRYFNQTRSYYLFRRLRVIAIALVLLQPAWILVDYYLLSAEIINELFVIRALTALACLVIGTLNLKQYSLRFSYVRLFLLVLVLSSFQTIASSLLIENGFSTSSSGYDFFPFMIITMLAVFPLAIVESFIYISGILVVELLTQSFRGELGSMQGINNLWLLSVLGVIAGWAAVNQMNMLLGLYRQATRDPLTGLSNRRQALEQLGNDIVICRSKSEPVSVLLFDLDKFKSFNDNYGHAAGDMVLKKFAQVIRKKTKRKTDIRCRYGGEEFLIVLPGRGIAHAEQIAEAIRLACHEETVKTPMGENIGFTTSIGVAELKNDETVDDLLQRADEALYQAKDNGRDQTALAV